MKQQTNVSEEISHWCDACGGQVYVCNSCKSNINEDGLGIYCNENGNHFCLSCEKWKPRQSNTKQAESTKKKKWCLFLSGEDKKWHHQNNQYVQNVRANVSLERLIIQCLMIVNIVLTW